MEQSIFSAWREGDVAAGSKLARDVRHHLELLVDRLFVDLGTTERDRLKAAVFSRFNAIPDPKAPGYEDCRDLLALSLRIFRPIAAWLYGVFSSKLGRKRDGNERICSTLTYDLGGSGGGEQHLVNAMTVDHVLSAMEPDLAHLLELRYLGGFKLREIAELVSLGDGQLDFRLNKAKEQFRTILDRDKGPNHTR